MLRDGCCQVIWRRGFESPELRSAEERHHRLTPPLFPLLPIIPSAPRTWAGNGVRGARREPHRYPGAGTGSPSHGAGTRLRPVTFATHCPLPRLSGHSVRPGHGTETQNRSRRPRDAGPSVRVGLLHQRAERSRKPAAPLDGTGPGRRRQPFPSLRSETHRGHAQCGSDTRTRPSSPAACCPDSRRGRASPCLLLLYQR